MGDKPDGCGGQGDFHHVCQCPMPNAQSPIPNPQSPIPNLKEFWQVAAIFRNISFMFCNEIRILH
ncbi:MAG: hypothetical protein ACHBN1_25655 [Heteroscytonema crispum UTEX LB 1556]